jgi:hypothetical protein
LPKKEAAMSSLVTGMPSDPQRVLSYATPGQPEPNLAAVVSWLALALGLFAGTCAVFECCEHTEEFFSKSSTNDQSAFACLIVALPVVVVLSLFLRLLLRRFIGWPIAIAMGVAGPLVAMLILHGDGW